jgi:hypothetical protein
MFTFLRFTSAILIIIMALLTDLSGAFAAYPVPAKQTNEFAEGVHRNIVQPVKVLKSENHKGRIARTFCSVLSLLSGIVAIGSIALI